MDMNRRQVDHFRNALARETGNRSGTATWIKMALLRRQLVWSLAPPAVTPLGASDPALRPDLTSSTICSLYSGGSPGW